MIRDQRPDRAGPPLHRTAARLGPQDRREVGRTDPPARFGDERVWLRRLQIRRALSLCTRYLSPGQAAAGRNGGWPRGALF